VGPRWRAEKGALPAWSQVHARGCRGRAAWPREEEGGEGKKKKGRKEKKEKKEKEKGRKERKEGEKKKENRKRKGKEIGKKFYKIRKIVREIRGKGFAGFPDFRASA
jgi:hypothetical protein